MTFDDVDRLVEEAQKPLDDEWLETLNTKEPDAANYHRFLYLLVRAIKPRVSLELGVHLGSTLAHLSAAAAEFGGHVMGIDYCPCELVATLQRRYGNVMFRQGDTTHIETVKWAHRVVDTLGPIGVIYQDSTHHYWSSWMEWDHYLPCLDGSAVWVCDDITESFHSPKFDPPERGMVQYFEELPGQKKLYPDVLHKGNTQGIVLVTDEIRDAWDGWYMLRCRKAGGV